MRMSLIVSILSDAGAYHMNDLGCNTAFSPGLLTGDAGRGHMTGNREVWDLAATATRPISRSVTGLTNSYSPF